MESAITGFLSIPTVIFAIVIWFITVAFRFVIERLALRIAYVFPDKWEPYWVDAWREWILPAAPVVIGGLVAYFVSSYPYPEVFASSDTARVFFGLVAGGLAGYAYRFFKYKLDQLLPERVKQMRNKVAGVLPPASDQKNEVETSQLTPAQLNAAAEKEAAKTE